MFAMLLVEVRCVADFAGAAFAVSEFAIAMA